MKPVSKKRPLTLRARIQGALRRAFSRSPERQACLVAARVSRNLYKCSECRKNFPRKLINVDHVSPIGMFVDWNSWIERLWCSESNLAVLCLKDHKRKTSLEATARAEAKRKNKA